MIQAVFLSQYGWLSCLCCHARQLLLKVMIVNECAYPHDLCSAFSMVYETKVLPATLQMKQPSVY